MIKINLCSEDLSFTLLLPVTPAEIVVTEGTKVHTYSTANDGNVSRIGANELTAVAFESHFPSNARAYSLNNALFGLDYVTQINRFRDRREPCRLIMTGAGFDKTMILEQFEWSLRKGKDVYYSMRFTEKR